VDQVAGAHGVAGIEQPLDKSLGVAVGAVVDDGHRPSEVAARLAGTVLEHHSSEDQRQRG
jgi:hypothetical protein